MRLCLFLLLAGVLDAVITHFGIASGYVEEGNPMMRRVIEHSWSHFYFIKIFLPLLLLGLFYLRPLKGWIRNLIISTCVLYVSVLVYHMFWIALYLNSST